MANRLARAWHALTGRDLKARGVNSPPLAGRIGTWQDGRGARVIPAGASLDYERQAGRLELNAVVAICLGWLYDNIATAEVKVGTKGPDGEYTAQDNHPLVTLLRRPNPSFSWKETLGGLAADLRIDGNAYGLKARDESGLVRELWWIPNWQVQVIPSPDPTRGLIDRYRVTYGSDTVDYPPSDIVHFRDMPDPQSPIVGLGRVKRQLRAVCGVNAGDTLTAAALRNAHTGVVLVPKADMPGLDVAGSPEQSALDAEARAIKRSFGGEGFGGVRAANLPLDYVRVGFTPEELMLDRILDRPEAFIAAAMGLNSLVLGLPSSNSTRTYSNLAEARKHAWEDGVVPLQDSIAETIQTQLLYAQDPATGESYGEFGDGPGLEVWWDRDDVPALREDADSRTQRVVMVYNAGSIVDEEWVRDQLGITLTPERVAALEARRDMATQQFDPETGEPTQAPGATTPEPDEPEPDDEGADADA